tara:strand:- start:5962 stop:6399 length:438 start_codon:yes stop_codon:yes gene_type:complete
MTWNFRGIGGNDIHGAPVESSPEPHVLRRYYWGISGETEVRSPSGSKDITLHVMVGSVFQYDRQGIITRIHEYEEEIGNHGDLFITDNNATITYETCTLDYVRRQDKTPMPDVAGSLHENPAFNPCYFQNVILGFKQITQETTVL